jgi:hypothetical protein
MILGEEDLGERLGLLPHSLSEEKKNEEEPEHIQ